MKIKNSILMICSFFLITGCSMMNISANKAPLSTEQKEKKGKDDIIDHQDSISLKAVYFNNVKSINGIDVIQNPSNILALVNKTYYLPSDYIPKELVRPLVAFSFGDLSLEKSFLRKKAPFALEKMFADAKKSDIELYAVSGYRSFSRQKKYLMQKFRVMGRKEQYKPWQFQAQVNIKPG